MNWYQSMWWEIKYWFNYHWVGLVTGLLLSMCVGVVIWKIDQIPPDVLFPPRVEQIVDLAEGKLISIRATGDWNIYDIELKFEDGSMLLVTYSFSRRNKLKSDHRYKIWDSSFHGYQCRELR